jgi:hypothetical protein
MSEINKISVFCEEKLIIIIKKWLTLTNKRMSLLQSQIENLQIGGNKFFGQQQWMQLQMEFDKLRRSIAKFDEDNLSTTLYNLLTELDKLYDYTFTIDNMCITLSNSDLLKAASSGSTRSIEDTLMDNKLLLISMISENELLVNTVCSIIYDNIKISGHITEIPNNTINKISASYFRRYLSQHKSDHVSTYMDNVLNNCIGIDSEHLPNSLIMAQKMIYGFECTESTDASSAHYYLGLNGSKNIEYNLRGLVDADYAAQNGGIGNMQSTMKLNLVKRLNTIVEVESDDAFTQGVNSDISVDQLQVGLNNKKINIKPVEGKWYPFDGAKRRLISYMENTEAIILSKLKKDAMAGWANDIVDKNEAARKLIAKENYGNLLSRIIDNAIIYFNKHQPETDIELRNLILFAENKSDNFIYESVYLTGMEKVAQSKHMREFAITQMHYSMDLTMVILSHLRKMWINDPTYDILLSNDSRRLNFVKRLKDILSPYFETSKLTACYLHSPKNYVLTNNYI